MKYDRRYLEMKTVEVLSFNLLWNFNPTTSSGSDLLIYRFLCRLIYNFSNIRTANLNSLYFTRTANLISLCFTRTAKLWSTETGKCYHTFKGHTAEIVCVTFNSSSTLVATGSMDTMGKIWDVETGVEMASLQVILDML